MGIFVVELQKFLLYVDILTNIYTFFTIYVVLLISYQNNNNSQKLSLLIYRIYRTLFISINLSQSNLSFFYHLIKPAMYSHDQQTCHINRDDGIKKILTEKISCNAYLKRNVFEKMCHCNQFPIHFNLTTLIKIMGKKFVKTMK